jgi:hypothetical protein
MPNYCNNSIRIYNLTAEQKRTFDSILKNYKEDFGLLSIFVPPPREDTVDWRYDNWGTKWDLQEPTYSSSDDCVEISCWTPWSPPSAGFNAISKQFPDAVIVLTYDEPGCDFTGKAVYRNGLVKEVEEEYSTIKDEWLKSNHPKLYESYIVSDDDKLYRQVEDLWCEVEREAIEEALDSKLAKGLEDLVSCLALFLDHLKTHG